MAKKIEVRWQAADGYAGARRPQATMIEVSDFAGLSRLEAERLFDEIMEEAFRQRVCWECDDYDGAISEIMAVAEKVGA